MGRVAPVLNAGAAHCRSREVHGVAALATEFRATRGVRDGLLFAPEPREVGLGAPGFVAAVFVPLDVGLRAEDASAFLADIGRNDERADVQADAVIEILMPADGLLLQWRPADKDVV